VRNVLWFILVCGLRRSQAVFLRWSAIDFDKKVVHLEASEGFDNKDYESNSLPMTEHMEEFLLFTREEARKRFKARANDFVFVDERGEHIRPDRLTHASKKLMREILGLEHGAVHILRHTSITMRHKNGMSLNDLKEIAGHSNIKTTMLYLHSEPEHLRSEMERTPIVQPLWIKKGNSV